MASNLLDMFKDVIGDQLVKGASSLLGEPSEHVSAATSTILAVLGGSIIQKGGTEAGAKELMEYLDARSFDGSMLPKVGEFLSGGAPTENLMNSGGGVLKYLLGDKLGSVTDLISGSSGLQTGSTKNLLKIAAPLLLSVFGKQMKRFGFDAAGVRDFLLNQRELVTSAVPEQVSNLMGFGSLSELGEIPVVTTIRQEPHLDHTQKPLLNRLLPWLVLLLAALALFYFLGRGCAGAKSRAANNMQTDAITETEKTENTEKTTNTRDTSRESTQPTSSVANSGSTIPTATAETFISKITKAIAEGKDDPNVAFILDYGSFQGRSAILTRESEKELEQFASVLKTFPTSEIRIEAHMDNSGNADINMQLSTQQALAVMTYLKDRGVALNRMSTKGRGQTKPLVPNDTDAAREQNKRVEIFVERKG